MMKLRILILTGLLTQLSYGMQNNKIPTPPQTPNNQAIQTPPFPEKPSKLNALLDEYKYTIGAGIVAVGALSTLVVAAKRQKRNALGYLPTQK